MNEEEKYTTLDTEQCKWWVNHLFSIAKEQACNSHNFDDGEEIQSAQDKIIKLLEQQSSDDCVSREQAKMDVIPNSLYTSEQVTALLDNLSSVTPTHCIAEIRFSKEDLRAICNERIEVECTHLTCKDCANYVMGALDEEICLRGHELIHKDFYCADFEKRGSEE